MFVNVRIYRIIYLCDLRIVVPACGSHNGKSISSIATIRTARNICEVPFYKRSYILDSITDLSKDEWQYVDRAGMILLHCEYLFFVIYHATIRLKQNSSFFPMRAHEWSCIMLSILIARFKRNGLMTFNLVSKYGLKIQIFRTRVLTTGCDDIRIRSSRLRWVKVFLSSSI